MKVIKQISEMRTTIRDLTQASKALVATMGNLHDGHLQLIKQAKQVADIVIVSIFVNPLQFGPNEDFKTYPRTLEQDQQRLEQLGINILFAPSTDEMYPQTENHTTVFVPKISDQYCGQSRPTFFYGVATVVAKLFNIVQPNYAIFGEKDFQQLHIIKKMVQDLCFPIEVIEAPTVREADGLAMSSRNQYLSPQERAAAPFLYETLCKLRTSVQEKEDTYTQLITEAADRLRAKGFRVDYLHILNRHTLELATEQDKELIILIATWLGKTRLIDNLLVDSTVIKSCAG
jgi:pantoate--beta-alanine ligase